MIALNDAKQNIGRQVIYQPLGQPDRLETGVITKVNDAGMIFVRYGEEQISKATRPADLYWGVDLNA
jgi:hypothetical protein